MGDEVFIGMNYAIESFVSIYKATYIYMNHKHGDMIYNNNFMCFFVFQ